MFAALAFVPPTDVKRRFVELLAILPEELQPLAEYFEATYIGTNFQQPMFPISFWSVLERVQNGVPRTSNFLERYHNKLNLLMKNRKPP